VEEEKAGAVEAEQDKKIKNLKFKIKNCKVELLVFFWVLIAGVGLTVTTGRVWANEKYVTIVYPIRSRALWKDGSLEPINQQRRAIESRGLKATWLIQNDVFEDKELLGYVKTFGENNEIGIFLEVSKHLAEKTKVYYPTETEWYSPRAVFLSGYEIGERKRLIDKMMADYKEEWGKYPESAGAWWIDSWSLDYLTNRFGIKTVLIVADQKTTDNYGVWGQWWGYPYHPSDANILVPGNMETVVIQWALRDPEKAFWGEGKASSNYSLQANDYSYLGLDIGYFENLANEYLSVDNLGQITVGLETGMESVGMEEEFEKQLDWIAEEKTEAVTMGEFADIYNRIYEGKNPKEVVVDGWRMTEMGRSNSKLGEKRNYFLGKSFEDKFVADREAFLDRVLPEKGGKTSNYLPWWLLVLPISWIWGRIWGIGGWKWLAINIWIMLIYLPLLKSFESNGWKVYFGPEIEALMPGQWEWMMMASLVAVVVTKKIKINGWWLILAMGWLTVIERARMTVIEGRYYLGWLVDPVRLVGIGIKIKPFELEPVNKVFAGEIAAVMLKFRSEWIWGDWYRWMIVLPAIMVTTAMVSERLTLKMPKGMRLFVGVILAGLTMVYVYLKLTADPTGVIELK